MEGRRASSAEQRHRERRRRMIWEQSLLFGLAKSVLGSEEAHVLAMESPGRQHQERVSPLSYSLGSGRATPETGLTLLQELLPGCFRPHCCFLQQMSVRCYSPPCSWHIFSSPPCTEATNFQPKASLLPSCGESLRLLRDNQLKEPPALHFPSCALARYEC